MKWLQPTDICVVTGGNNGLGAEILREFARQGCQTVSLDIKAPVATKSDESPEGSESIFSEFSKTDGATSSVEDSSEEFVEKLVEQPVIAVDLLASKDSSDKSTTDQPLGDSEPNKAVQDAKSLEDSNVISANPLENSAEKENSPATKADDPQSESKTEGQLEEDISPTLSIDCDVRSQSDLENALNKILKEFNRYPTVVVLNAGIRRSLNSIAEASFDDLQDTIDVNLGGVLKSMRVFLPEMIQGERGFVVVVASALGIVVPKGLGAYGASKAGLIGIHEALVQETRDYRDVHSLLVCPGQLNTTMFSDIKTPSDYLAPVVPVQKLASKVVKRVVNAKTSTIYSPSYVRYLPFMNAVPISLSRFARKFSGVDSAYDDAVAKRKAQEENEANAANTTTSSTQSDGGITSEGPVDSIGPKNNDTIGDAESSSDLASSLVGHLPIPAQSNPVESVQLLSAEGVCI